MHTICKNMHQICIKYASKMMMIKHAKNMPLHRLQHSKYAKNMQKICKKYAQYATKICKKYAKNMQNMHKSMYLHILHIYALPTLLMKLRSARENCQWHCCSRVPVEGSLLSLRLGSGQAPRAACQWGSCGHRDCQASESESLIGRSRRTVAPELWRPQLQLEPGWFTRLPVCQWWTTHA